MRKGFLVMLAVVLVAALAAPAMAGTDINGFYRTKAWMSNFRTGGDRTAPMIGKDSPTNAFVEQRMRLKFSSGEENVKAVAQFEIDFGAWGDVAGSSKQATSDNTGLGAGRNSGGALGSDRINLETKNVYLWFKLPGTPVDFTVGLQGVSDAYAGLLFGAADMAGIVGNGKFGPVAATLGWAKLYEYDTSKTDDLTAYLATVKFSPTKDVKVGVNLYFLQDDTFKTAQPFAIATGTGALFSALNTGLNKKKVYIPGVDFAFNAGPATISGFGLYEFGKVDYLSSSTSDIDISGYALDLRGDLNVGPGKAFVEALYLSGGDNNANKVKSIVTFSDLDASPGGNSAFARTDMSILMVNGDDINCAQALTGARATAAGGSTSPALTGRGITHLAGGFSLKMGDKVSGKVGLGWLRANNLLLTDTTKKGKTLGTEINANVGVNIMKGLDFGLYAAYGWLGDFYKDKTGSVPDPDNIFSANMRLNYAF